MRTVDIHRQRFLAGIDRGAGRIGALDVALRGQLCAAAARCQLSMHMTVYQGATTRSTWIWQPGLLTVESWTCLRKGGGAGCRGQCRQIATVYDNIDAGHVATPGACLQ
jgi:hypothetical protein